MFVFSVRGLSCSDLLVFIGLKIYVNSIFRSLYA